MSTMTILPEFDAFVSVELNIIFFDSTDWYLSVQNFEAAVQDNVLVNGESWEEAPDDEGDSF